MAEPKTELKEGSYIETSDGKPFINDKKGAESHQALLDAMKPADDYEAALKKAGWNEGRTLANQVNRVKDYLAWKETGTPPQPPEAKVKPPATEPPPDANKTDPKEDKK